MYVFRYVTNKLKKLLNRFQKRFLSLLKCYIIPINIGYILSRYSHGNGYHAGKTARICQFNIHIHIHIHIQSTHACAHTHIHIQIKNKLIFSEPARKHDKHNLVKGVKKRNCVGCYEKLRTFLTSRQADKKVKKF